LVAADWSLAKVPNRRSSANLLFGSVGQFFALG